MSRKLDRANRKMSDAAERVAEWEQTAARLAGELAAAERSVGASALESGDVAAVARGVADLRGQVDAARQAVEAARAAQREAEREALQVEAADLRGEANRLDREADKHGKHTRELLDQLREREGCDYRPIGRVVATGAIVDLGHGARTGELRRQAAAARAKAAALEKRAVALAPHPEPASNAEPKAEQPPSVLRAEANRLRRTADGHERGARSGPKGDRLRAQAADYRRRADQLDEQAARAEASERQPSAVAA